MQVNPITAAWIMGAFTLIGLIGHTPLPSWVPAKIGGYIQSTCIWLATIGNGVGVALHLVSSPVAGPLAQ
jgi:hypothetical protein